MISLKPKGLINDKLSMITHKGCTLVVYTLMVVAHTMI